MQRNVRSTCSGAWRCSRQLIDKNDLLTKNMRMKRPTVFICVVGLGEMGVIHARNLARIPFVHLALASKRPDVVQTLGDELCVPNDLRFSSYDSALNCKRIDAVVIATKPCDHPNHIVLAAKAGKYLFCEKPLGTCVATIQSALEIVEQQRLMP